MAFLARTCGTHLWQRCANIGLIAAALLGGAAVGGCASASAHSESVGATPANTGPQQMTFHTPDEAVGYLYIAALEQDSAGMQDLFGPHMKEFGSGNHQQDKADFQRLAASMQLRRGLDRNDDGSYTLVVGAQNWNFPAPLVKDGENWRFDTDTGIKELAARKISHDEREAVYVCRQYVIAQGAYKALNPDKSAEETYAAKLASTTGQHDGLYWDAKPGEPESPFGPLVARAAERGYTTASAQRKEPYRGYFFRILTAQGPNAQGGALSYLVAGKLTKGFALVAFPAEYGKSGVHTFIVNQDGVVYEKDQGPNSAATARSMESFDPGQGWTKIQDEE